MEWSKNKQLRKLKVNWFLNYLFVLLKKQTNKQTNRKKKTSTAYLHSGLISVHTILVLELLKETADFNKQRVNVVCVPLICLCSMVMNSHNIKSNINPGMYYINRYWIFLHFLTEYCVYTLSIIKQFVNSSIMDSFGS